MDDHIQRILIDRERIERRVGELAQQIAEDFLRETADEDDPQLTLIAIPTGSLIFLADLIRHLPVMLRIRLVTVVSYPGKTTQSLGPRLEGQLPDDLAGHHVLLVDDILDTGNTFHLVTQMLRDRQPATLKSCMLLRKKIPSAMAIDVDYIGFDIDDAFVVGYGLDYDGYYRNLPEIVTLKNHLIEQGADA
ncbi:MAG: hypoxanthine phosphoribosyltransferase [Planctomycetota bacterium]|jgi:hypoxanthine phosphoribosyltransferase